MKQLLVFIFILIAGTAWTQNIPAKPNPARLVNDFAHVMTPDQVQALENKLVAYDDSTSTQLVVVTVETTGDYPIEEYALKILRDWGVGNKKTNNGAVIVAAIKDHKIRIETGGGLEGSVPDVTASHIIESSMTPNFRNENYYRGFDEATDDIIKAAAGEYKAPANYRKKGDGGGSVGVGIVVFIIIIIIISRIRNGGGGGGMMSRRGSSLWMLPALMNLGNSGNSGWGGSGGGGWSGGGGGGGFGGFGGGSGGGGGASGGW